jgi:hypothetical protein
VQNGVRRLVRWDEKLRLRVYSDEVAGARGTWRGQVSGEQRVMSSAHGTNTLTIEPPEGISAEALEFCFARGLAPQLGTANDSARKHFSIVGRPFVNLVQDPEDDHTHG